jgi:hypothetical protein
MKTLLLRRTRDHAQTSQNNMAQESAADDRSETETIGIADLLEPDSTPDPQCCIKLILIVSALGFLLGGVFCVSSQDAGVIDWYYPSWNDPYVDANGKRSFSATVTLFVDSTICYDGECKPFSNDSLICDRMKETFADFRADALSLGVMMIGTFLLVTSAVFGKGILHIIAYCRFKATRKRSRPEDWFSPAVRTWASRLLFFSGIAMMFVILAFAVLIFEAVYRISYVPLCDTDGPQASAGFNVSLADTTPNFSYGRGLNLNLYAALIVFVVDGTLLLWFIFTCCHRFWTYSDDGEDGASESADEEAISYEAMKQAEDVRALEQKEAQSRKESELHLQDTQSLSQARHAT